MAALMHVLVNAKTLSWFSDCLEDEGANKSGFRRNSIFLLASAHLALQCRKRITCTSTYSMYVIMLLQLYNFASFFRGEKLIYGAAVNRLFTEPSNLTCLF